MARIKQASSNNRDIRSFFGSSQVPSQASQSPAPSNPPPPATPPATKVPSPRASPIQEELQLSQRTPEKAASPLRDFVASPTTPPEFPPSTPTEPEQRQAITRDTVIKASDDEDESSDEDFLDIFAGMQPRVTAAPPAPPAARPLRRSPHNHACVTPRAKRIATAQEFHSSPLTIQRKPKQYDFATILALTEEDEASRVSAQRFTALLEEEKKEKEREQRALNGYADIDDEEFDAGGEPMSLSQEAEDESAAARRLKERMRESAVAAAVHGVHDDDEGEGGPSGMRVVRALDRADLGGRAKTYYFFEQTEPEANVVGRTFPTAAAKDVWAILKDTEDRGRHFQSGFLFDLQKMFKNMPDEIFLWVLDEVCSETRRDLAAEYAKLLRLCNSQMERVLTPDRLKQLFRSLGATRDVERLNSHITLRTESGDPYSRRNWLCLENFLKLMGEGAASFNSATRTTAMQILLRLGMDPVAMENFGMLHEWRWTVDLVARSVPSRDWAGFCRGVCTSLYASTEKNALRYRAIAALGPVGSQYPDAPAELQRRTLDLKRRLASAFFFDDPKRADTRPEDTVTIRAVIDRLEEDEFQLNAETDFKELHALMMLLNVALGDASKDRVLSPLIANTLEGRERERVLMAEFDAEVDELAESMKSMVTRVAPLSKGVHEWRIETKNAMELIRERLVYQVRIKPVPKIKMFGDDGEDVGSHVKQQDFMKGFFLKKGKNKMATPASPSPEIEMTMA